MERSWKSESDHMGMAMRKITPGSTSKMLSVTLFKAFAGALWKRLPWMSCAKGDRVWVT